MNLSLLGLAMSQRLIKKRRRRWSQCCKDQYKI